GHVPGLEGLIWNFALRRFGGRTNHFWASHKASAGKTSSTDCDAERTQQVSSVHWCWFVHIVHEIPPFDAHSGRRSYTGILTGIFVLFGRADKAAKAMCDLLSRVLPPGIPQHSSKLCLNCDINQKEAPADQIEPGLKTRRQRSKTVT